MQRNHISSGKSAVLGVFFAGLCVAQLFHSTMASAQNVLSVQDTMAAPGTTGVKIPINLTVDRNLTSLVFDITFDTSLCAVIADHGDGEITGVVVGADDTIAVGKDIVVRRTSLVKQPLQEQLFTCSDGKIRIAALDLSGNPVILAGSGQIATIELDLRNPATGNFPLTPANIQARLGPLSVSIQPQAGTLKIVGSPGCVPADCNDMNACTSDVCQAGVCQHPPVPPACGNGCLESGEECDDGGSADGDGCSADCHRESQCGDGQVDRSADPAKNEQCDDGNTSDGDGCSAQCQLELAPGGISKTECFLEWFAKNPTNLAEKDGLPSLDQTCVDGDPFCDFDSVEGQCTFQVKACLNIDDPRLVNKKNESQCTPTDIAEVDIKKAENLGAAFVALGGRSQGQCSAGKKRDFCQTDVDCDTTPGSGDGQCRLQQVVFEPPVAQQFSCTDITEIVVPLASGRTGFKKATDSFTLKATTSVPEGAKKASSDTDTLKLTCLPEIPCGGIAALPCGKKQVCDLRDDTCAVGVGLAGVCMPSPPKTCPDNAAPVCGCDGVTYDNDCKRLQTGATLAHLGPC